MKKILIAFLITWLVFEFQLNSCTTFCISNENNLTVGYSFDWFAGMGMAISNSSNTSKIAFIYQDENPVKWTSKYNSITFNLMGKEFPFAGMNEKGLVVTQMWLNNTVYPEKDARSSVTELQWIQYQLDNFKTVEEVIHNCEKIRISDKCKAPLHYFISDKKGTTASVEFIKGKVIIHSAGSMPYPVLTNRPYSKSVEIAEKTDMNEVDSVPNKFRFGKTCFMLNHSESVSNGIDYAFEILNQVRQKNTKWNIVFDQNNLQIHYKTFKNKNVRTLNLSDMFSDCKETEKFIDIHTNITDISNQLQDYTPEVHKNHILDLKSKMVNAPISEDYWETLMEYIQ